MGLVDSHGNPIKVREDIPMHIQEYVQKNIYAVHMSNKEKDNILRHALENVYKLLDNYSDKNLKQAKLIISKLMKPPEEAKAPKP